MMTFLYLFLGSLFWTFCEYMIHRFLGHKFKKNRFYTEHTKHHFKKFYFASTLEKGITATIFCLALGSLTYYLVGKAFAIPFTLSFVVTYLVYEIVHRRVHAVEAPNRYAAFLRAHHLYHHFVDENVNHGVTTPFWDIVFKTFVKTSEVPVPMRNPIIWLKDLNVDESYVDRYGNRYRMLKKVTPIKYGY